MSEGLHRKIAGKNGEKKVNFTPEQEVKCLEDWKKADEEKALKQAEKARQDKVKSEAIAKISALASLTEEEKSLLFK